MTAALAPKIDALTIASVLLTASPTGLRFVSQWLMLALSALSVRLPGPDRPLNYSLSSEPTINSAYHYHH